MNKAKIATGTCLCGRVSMSFALEKDTFDACHCGMCRKWGGGPALAVHAGKDVSIKGEEFITTYDSSEWADRGFCKQCGTHLFYRLKQTGSYFPPLGLLSNVEHLKFHMQIFIDMKPSHYSFAEKTEHMTEAEFLANYAPS